LTTGLLREFERLALIIQAQRINIIQHEQRWLQRYLLVNHSAELSLACTFQFFVCERQILTNCDEQRSEALKMRFRHLFPQVLNA